MSGRKISISPVKKTETLAITEEIEYQQPQQIQYMSLNVRHYDPASARQRIQVPINDYTLASKNPDLNQTFEGIIQQQLIKRAQWIPSRFNKIPRLGMHLQAQQNEMEREYMKMRQFISLNPHIMNVLNKEPTSNFHEIFKNAQKSNRQKSSDVEVKEKAASLLQ